MNRTVPIHPDSYADFLTRDELARIQLDRLQNIVALSYEHVDLTRRRMQAIGLKPGDIRSLADVARLPSRRSPTCATPIRTGCSPVPCAMSFACMPPAEPQESLSL